MDEDRHGLGFMRHYPTKFLSYVVSKIYLRFLALKYIFNFSCPRKIVSSQLF